MHVEKIVICLISAVVSISASEILAEVFPVPLLTLDGVKEGLTDVDNVNLRLSPLKGTENNESCNSTRRCQNGGKCETVCKCLKGTSGQFCEDVEACRDRNCGSKYVFHCGYNVKKQRAECFCSYHDDYAYDESTRTCRECHCKKYGDCSAAQGKRECSCYEGFSFVDLYYEPFTCKRCDCGLWSKGCKYDSYKKMCTCLKGFAQNLDYQAEKCQRCDCGENGKCSFQRVSEENKKVCDCNENYLELNGYCEECNCGKGVKCDFDDRGSKVCHCQPGEGVKDGKCSACDCGLEGVGCTFNSKGNKRCSCPPGYEDRGGGQCQDVNECQDANVCPFSTRCDNRNGSFDCPCAEGFQLLNGTDPKVRGCDDVDECKEKNVCSPNAVCVNTLGSYRCMCVGQYTATYPDESASSTLCTDNTSDAWKIPGIVFIVVFAVLAMVSIFMLNKNRESE